MISVRFTETYKPSMQSCYAVLLLISMLLIVSGCSTTTNTSPNTSTSTSKEIANSNNPTELQEQKYKTALLALDSKDFKTAETLLLELKTNNPNLSGPWANLGLIRLIQKQPVEAEAYLLKALELNPKLAKAQNLMGLIATHNKQLDKAENYYKQAIKINGDYSNAHYNLALLYDIYLQDIERAAKHYRIYSTLTNDSDTETLSWLEHLESTLKQQL